MKTQQKSMKNKIAELLAVSLVMSLTSASTPAFAQADRAGNGGDALICGTKVMMLDSVETTNVGRPVYMPSKDESLRSKVELLISRIAEKNLLLSKAIGSEANILLSDVESFEKNQNKQQANTAFGNGELPNVADEGATFIPQGCQIAQLIVRTPNPLPNQKLYSVREELWKMMDMDEKAAAITHEATYGYLVSHGVNSSPSARWLNGLVISGGLASLSDREFRESLKSFLFPYLKWARKSSEFTFIFDPWSIKQFSADGSIAKIEMAEIQSESTPLIQGSHFEFKSARNIVLDHGVWQAFSIDDYVVFDLDSKEYFGQWDYERGGNDVHVSKKDIAAFRSRNVLGMHAATVTRLSNGFTISNVLKYHWRINPAMFAPVVNLLLMSEAAYVQRYEFGTIELNSDRQITSMKFEDLKFKNMRHYPQD